MTGYLTGIYCRLADGREITGSVVLAAPARAGDIIEIDAIPNRSFRVDAANICERFVRVCLEIGAIDITTAEALVAQRLWIFSDNRTQEHTP